MSAVPRPRGPDLGEKEAEGQRQPRTQPPRFPGDLRAPAGVTSEAGPPKRRGFSSLGGLASGCPEGELFSTGASAPPGAHYAGRGARQGSEVGECRAGLRGAASGRPLLT